MIAIEFDLAVQNGEKFFVFQLLDGAFCKLFVLLKYSQRIFQIRVCEFQSHASILLQPKASAPNLYIQ